MIIQILGVIPQVAFFVMLCLLGARLSQRLYVCHRHAPLAVAGTLIVAMAVYLFAFQPAIGFVVQTIGLWLVAFAGGMLGSAQQIYTNE